MTSSSILAEDYQVVISKSNKELILRITKRGLDSGRVDDQSEDKINNRIRVYKNETIPVLNHYEKLNKYTSINGVGSIDEIFNKICSKIEN